MSLTKVVASAMFLPVALIGTTSDDLPVLFPPRDNPLSFFGAAANPAAAIKNVAVDMTMHEPARFVARQVTAAGQPAWLYRFGYIAESLRPKASGAGAQHSSEIPYLFGTLDVRYGAATTAKDRAMADLFMGYIAAFARTGDPNRSGLPPWPRYGAVKSDLMMLTPDATAIMQADPWESRLDLIERAVERQAAAAKEPGPTR